MEKQRVISEAMENNKMMKQVQDSVVALCN